MLNHFNFEKFEDRVLVTNDLGRYLFLTDEEFLQFVTKRVKAGSALYEKLAEGYFLLPDNPGDWDEDLIFTLRDMKNYVTVGPILHIFVVTNICNINCVYCQARDHRSGSAGMMTEEIGFRAIDIALKSPEEELTFEFQGGEPLLNFPLIRAMILYSEAHKGNKTVFYTLVSNLMALTEEMIGFFREYGVTVSTSMDGPRLVHEHNRRAAGTGKSSFDAMAAGLARLQEAGISSGAIETSTRFSLDYPKEIVDAYREHGISQIFLRPLTPLGFAREDWEKVGYRPEEFLKFYKRALDYIIELNKQGEYFPEINASNFLRKILFNDAYNYMDLRSPCGATMGQLTYYYNGDIFTCDEGRMVFEGGDSTFRLGNVFDSNYETLMTQPVCRKTSMASVIEGLPTCSDCVFQPYCGVCPVITYAWEGDMLPRQPHGYRCQIHRGIQKILFELLLHGDEKTIEVLKSWVD